MTGGERIVPRSALPEAPPYYCGDRLLDWGFCRGGLVAGQSLLVTALVRGRQEISDLGRNSAAFRDFIVDSPKMPKNNYR